MGRVAVGVSDSIIGSVWFQVLAGLLLGFMSWRPWEILGILYTRLMNGLVLRLAGFERDKAARKYLLPPEDKLRYVFFILRYDIAYMSFAVLIGLVWVLLRPLLMWQFVLGAGILRCILQALWAQPSPVRMPGRAFLREIIQSKAARHAMYVRMVVHDQVSEGKRYRDIDPALYKRPTDENLKSELEFHLLHLEVACLYDAGLHDEGYALLTSVNPETLSLPDQTRISVEGIFYYTIHRPDLARAQEYWTHEGVEKWMAKKDYNGLSLAAIHAFFVKGNHQQGRELFAKAKGKIEEAKGGYVVMREEELALLEARMDEVQERLAHL